LATLLERRTAGTADALPPGPERRAKLLELASIHEQHLDRPYEAVDALERLIAQLDQEESPPTIAGAGQRAHGVRGRWRGCTAALTVGPRFSTRSSAPSKWGGDPVAALDLRLRIAAVQEKEMAQPAEAIEAYESVLAQDPKNAEAMDALERLLEKEARWESLEELLGRRMEKASGNDRVRLGRRRAKLLQERLGNPTRPRRRCGIWARTRWNMTIWPSR